MLPSGLSACLNAAANYDADTYGGAHAVNFLGKKNDDGEIMLLLWEREAQRG